MDNSEVTFLRATSADFELARQAIAEVHLPTSHYHGPVEDAALAAFLADPGCHLLLAVAEEKPVGSLYGYSLRQPYRRGPQFFLYGIDVRLQFAGCGIGTALVNRFISDARLAGASEVWVLSNQSNEAAMVMYARCGLKRSADDDVVLILSLD